MLQILLQAVSRQATFMNKLSFLPITYRNNLLKVADDPHNYCISISIQVLSHPRRLDMHLESSYDSRLRQTEGNGRDRMCVEDFENYKGLLHDYSRMKEEGCNFWPPESQNLKSTARDCPPTTSL
jgi:hypothetical protein